MQLIIQHASIIPYPNSHSLKKDKQSNSAQKESQAFLKDKIYVQTTKSVRESLT
jgi:hypothetical protein